MSLDLGDCNPTVSGRDSGTLAPSMVKVPHRPRSHLELKRVLPRGGRKRLEWRVTSSKRIQALETTAAFFSSTDIRGLSTEY